MSTAKRILDLSILHRLVVTLLVMVGLGVSQAGMAEAAPASPRPVVASSVAAAGQMTMAQFRATKASLDASGFARTQQSVPGGVEYRYTSAAGMTVTLARPTGPVTPSLGAGGCGFLQLCVYFNRTDQNAILAGAGAGIAAAICFIPAVGQAGCVAAAVVVAVATTYLQSRGICRNQLRVRIFPFPGSPKCV